MNHNRYDKNKSFRRRWNSICKLIVALENGGIEVVEASPIPKLLKL